ncbi:glycoside hydrolase family 13 protein [Natranaeroarchaeum sulfidigenes]|uniref:Glycosidase n=1 Tax=Natranaeroarchaeum sulfidigenes TaxID=2784880 RepID=A0A897MKH7_9EURY|nr:alpha-glucosidase [Natranaeroarchaeum sulfidigenes]QSG02620.1 Glycosidase [Natranaeroarchaeum sulfidigenes]
MNSTSRSTDREWWKEAVVYQIYPQSFNDSNGDGVGDIPGIIEKVDYLDALGVDVVWLNPVYESPMADNGYDIADYRSIHPEYGTVNDWERLLEELHDRDIRLIMDLVVNHTSDEHEWFQRSRRGDPEYEDYYYWREGDPEEPPNNWESFFGGPAWSWDDEREAWYLHLFDEKQPDLNWRNPDVRDDIFDMMTWWLDKGIDGFRMDVINLISKTEGLPDGETGTPTIGTEHFADGPRLGEYLDEMNERVLSNYDVMTVGEMAGGMTAEDAEPYVGEDGPLSMIIHFEHVHADVGEGGKWDVVELDLDELRSSLHDWQTVMAEDGWNCLYLDNHDQPRAVSRFGDDGEYREESAKMLATFLFTLQGTPFVFQGQEIGMTNTTFEDPEKVRDVESKNFLNAARDRGESFEDVRPLLEARSRDNARTPMQWDDSEYAGFTDGEPWIHVNDNYTEINVEAARADGDSIWQYYRELIDLREEREVFVYGEYELLLPDHDDVYAYRRTLDEEALLVVCNFFEGEPTVELPVEDANLLLGNYPDLPDEQNDEIELRPYEARIYER